MPDTVLMHNPTDKAVALSFVVLPAGPGYKGQIERFVVPAHGALDLPLKFFRAVLHVRCAVEKCRDLAWCTKGHAGQICGGQAPQLTFTPVAEEIAE